MLVGSRVVDVIERRHERYLYPSELTFEDADVPPRMIGLMLGGNSPQVVPLVSRGLGSAHDFEMEQVGRHHASVQSERAAEEISRSAAKIHHQRRRQPSTAILSEEQREFRRQRDR